MTNQCRGIAQTACNQREIRTPSATAQIGVSANGCSLLWILCASVSAVGFPVLCALVAGSTQLHQQIIVGVEQEKDEGVTIDRLVAEQPCDHRFPAGGRIRRTGIETEDTSGFGNI